MDLRIVNTCNNNCLFCLENSHREINKKYISTKILFDTIDNFEWRITFYWWNPLLHPDLINIIKKCKSNNYNSIGLLSNTYGLNKWLLDIMKDSWLSSFWFYFNSFDKYKHKIVNWNWIWYWELLNNLILLKESGLILKTIININNLNIDNITRDVLILNNKYWIRNFDFVNYFPFDTAYDNKNLLEYDFAIKRGKINSLFNLIKKLRLNVRFVKFSKDFFWNYPEFYDFQKWILEQIWEEDIERLKWDEKPTCFDEKRCKICFIKDNCKFYEI